MTDYSELVKALRWCDASFMHECDNCLYLTYKHNKDDCMDRMLRDAAVAIEELQAGVKRGEWLNVTDSYSWYGKCSVCGEEFEVDAYYAGGMNYCPNCGAKMEVQDDKA